MTEQEKIEKAYEWLLENFLFGKLGVTKENYKKIEYDVFSGAHSPQERFLQKFMSYIRLISKITACAYIARENGEVQDPEEFNSIILSSLANNGNCLQMRSDLCWHFFNVCEFLGRVPLGYDNADEFLEIFQETFPSYFQLIRLLFDNSMPDYQKKLLTGFQL